MIKIECKCTHKVLLPDSFAGRQVRCPRCKRTIEVPGQVVEYQLPRTPKAAAAKPAKPPKAAAAPQPQPELPFEEDVFEAIPPAAPPVPTYGRPSDQPRRVRASGGGSSTMLLVIFLVALAAFIAVIVLVATNRLRIEG